jgi:hypothetical protein
VPRLRAGGVREWGIRFCLTRSFLLFFYRQKRPASGRASGRRRLAQVGRGSALWRLDPENLAPPVIDLQAGTFGAKNTLQCSVKKNNRESTAKMLPWRRSDGPECLIAVEASCLCTNYTFRYAVHVHVGVPHFGSSTYEVPRGLS